MVNRLDNKDFKVMYETLLKDFYDLQVDYQTLVKKYNLLVKSSGNTERVINGNSESNNQENK